MKIKDKISPEWGDFFMFCMVTLALKFNITGI